MWANLTCRCVFPIFYVQNESTFQANLWEECWIQTSNYIEIRSQTYTPFKFIPELWNPDTIILEECFIHLRNMFVLSFVESINLY